MTAPSPPYALGVDVGGTRIKMACVESDGRVLSESVIETQDDGSTGWRDALVAEARRLEAERGARARWLGLAAPGLVARDGLSIAFMPERLRGLVGTEWAAALGDAAPLSGRVPVLNDAHAALFGELWLGAARGLRDVILLTLGTGVGGAVISDGRLLRGHIGRAGHLGHVSLDPDGPLDITHAPGSLEDAIGNATLARRSDGRFHSTKELVRAYLGGDPDAARVWLKSLRALAAAIASFANAFDPEAIVLGGGIAQTGEALFRPLEELVAGFEWRPAGHRVHIIPARLGDRAGALGAAYHALREATESTR